MKADRTKTVTIAVRVPAKLASLIKEKAAAENFTHVSEYARHLMRRAIDAAETTLPATTAEEDAA